MEQNDFKKHIGKTFKVAWGHDSHVELKLVAVEPLPTAKTDTTRERKPFELRFLGPVHHHLPDNSYTMRIKGVEDQLIFISAFEQNDDGIHYQAIFN